MFKKELYAPYWNQFSRYIRYERAKNKCERCGAKNGSIVERGYLDDSKETPIYFDIDTGDTYHAKTGENLGRHRSYELNLERITRIVLTVAHLDGKSGICFCFKKYGLKCARPEHCLALCQACHLFEDLDKHVAVRKKNLAKKKDKERGLLNL